MLESSKMVVCMITHLMTCRYYLPIQIGVFAHIVAHHKECGTNVKLRQCLENERRRLGYWSIVKCDIHRPFA